MKSEHPGLIEHLETHLGPIRAGWKMESAPGGRLFIVEFADQPVEGAVTYATLGLSEHTLRQEDGPPICQELLFSLREGEARPEDAVLLMKTLVAPVLESRRSLDRGQVLGPAGPVLEGSTLEAFYCSFPAYFPEELAVFRGVTPAVFFVWLIPITRDEARFIEQRDWESFEELLEEQDPELLDLRRTGLNLPFRR